jgi:hypothetical protein
MSLPPVDAWDQVPFDSGRWQISAVQSRVEHHLGRESLCLKGGIATVAGARFSDGVIELDAAFSGERGFAGGIWRVQDSRNYEEFYLRPHQSGNPDANQYTPVFNGLSGWQLYHGERYSVPVAYRFHEWTRIRIVFSAARAAIYIDGLETPVLVVEDLKRDAGPGGVGVSCENFAPAHFSNFSFLATDSPPIPERPGTPEPVPEGVIPSWWVSDLLAEKALEGRCEIGAEDVASRNWSRLGSERSGLANLARVQGINIRKNTAFARTVIHSDREQVKRLDFGFSDRVRVYLNRRLLFHGNDTCRSRDYRFLGSIGYFDALYLPLAKGENELLMAVSEDLGGWGVQAKLEDLAGITLQD